MSKALKECRLARSYRFNEFTKRILEFEGEYPKTLIRELKKYRRLFVAILYDDELHELAESDLRWLSLIESYVEFRNAEQTS